MPSKSIHRKQQTHDELTQYEGGGKSDKYKDDLDGYKAPQGFNYDRSGCGADCIWGLIFLAFVASMVFLTYLGFKEGDVKKLLAPVVLGPVSNNYELCGYSNQSDAAIADGINYDNTGYDKMVILEWPVIGTDAVAGIFEIKAMIDSGVCVSACPIVGEETTKCDTDKHGDCPTVAAAQLTDGSTDILGMCIPSSPPQEVLDSVEGLKAYLLNPDGIGPYVEDLYRSSRSIFLSLAMSVVYSIVFIYFLSAFGEAIAWICVIILQLGLLSVAGLGWYMWNGAVMASEGLTDEILIEKNEKDQKIYMAVMIGGGVFALGFLCCVCCGYSSLKIAIDVIDASADFMAKSKRVIAVPFFFFLCQLITVLIWVPCMAYVVSLNHVEVNSDIPLIKDIYWEPKFKAMAAYMIFGVIWVTAFFEYCSTFVIMVSASTYYWTSNPMAEGSAEVALGFQYCFTHFGSLAIGSFVIALVRFLRLTVMYMAQQMEKAGGDNQAIKYMVGCAQCVLGCIEKICDYINESAYAYQAITGDQFCPAAWNAFMLQLRHMLKFSFAQMIAKIFIFLGKIGIVAGNMVSCYYIMKLVFKDFESTPATADSPEDPAVTQAAGSVLLVGVFSFMVASIFLGLLDTAVLSLLTCVAIDMDNNDGAIVNGPPTFHDGGQLAKFDSAEEHAKKRQQSGFEEEGGIREPFFEQREQLGNEKFRQSWIYHFFY